MIHTIGNQKDEIFDSREGPHSTIEKSSNENTPNMSNQSPPSNSFNVLNYVKKHFHTSNIFKK